MAPQKVIDLTRFATILLASIVIGLGTWVWKTNERLERIEAKNHVDEDQNEVHDEMDERIRKFWKLHAWSRDEINQLRALHDLDMSRWPD